MDDSIGKAVAVVLAAGQGKRMGSSIQKQYMELAGKPLICYALDAFEKSSIDEVILVTGSGEVDYCLKNIVRAYGFQKVVHIIEGGRERYHSVYEGLKAATGCAYVLIHDGARPLITQEIINSAWEGAVKYGACVIGMPVKDTIKIADKDSYSWETPKRESLWAVQTPQAFQYQLIWDAYSRLFEAEENQTGITDDAMVVETMTDYKVKLLPGSYSNIKVTTPEDMAVADAFLKLLK